MNAAILHQLAWRSMYLSHRTIHRDVSDEMVIASVAAMYGLLIWDYISQSRAISNRRRLRYDAH